MAPTIGPNRRDVVTTIVSPRLKYPPVAGKGIVIELVAIVVRAPITAIAARVLASNFVSAIISPI